MQNQLERTQGKVGNLTSFVRDVANMEVSHYTLVESARQAREKAENDERRATDNLEWSRKNLQNASEDLNKAKAELQEISTFKKYFFKYEMTGAKDFFAMLGIFIFTFAVTGELVVMLLSYPFGVNPYENDYLIPVIIGWLIIYLVIAKLLFNRGYKSKLREKESNANRCLEKYNEAMNTVKMREEEYNAAKDLLLVMTKRADEFEYSAREVRKNLDVCYQLGIIPPSYRNLVCAVLLADVFMNDKADTMREAVLLCDVEIRHAEIVNKLTDIDYSLKSLAVSIHSIGGLLEDINKNISTIGESIASRQEKIAYAADSIKQSMDNVEFYINQKRAEGL